VKTNLNLRPDGTYDFDGSQDMPCEPTAVRMLRWIIPQSFGKAEAEEAAARLISFSAQRGRWVGVSWLQLGQMVLGELEERRLYEEAVQLNEGLPRRNAEKLAAYQKAMIEYRAAMIERRVKMFLALITFGLYEYRPSTPEPPARPVLDQPVLVPSEPVRVFTVSILDPQLFINGVLWLIERGYVEKVTLDDGDDAVDVLVPTRQMIQFLVEKQGIAAPPPTAS